MKLMTLTTFWKDFASQNLSFFDPFSIDFSCFFQNPSWRALLAPKMPIYAQNHDFGTPFRFSKGPKSALGPPFSRKKLHQSPSLFYGSVPGSQPAPHDPPKPPQIAFLSILDGFGWIFNGFWSIWDGLLMDCWWIFGRLFDGFSMDSRSIFYIDFLNC